MKAVIAIYTKEYIDLLKIKLYCYEKGYLQLTNDEYVELADNIREFSNILIDNGEL